MSKPSDDNDHNPSDDTFCCEGCKQDVNGDWWHYYYEMCVYCIEDEVTA